MHPKISVIMSTYNEPEIYIKEAIESILNQTFGDFEFIIVIDNPDNLELKNVLENYALKDRRITLIKNEKNYGAAKSRNNGIDVSKGKYISIMDADDISLPNRLQTQYEYLEKNPEIFLIGSGIIDIEETGKEIAKHKMITSETKLKKILEKRNAINHPTIMFKNDKNTYYREKFRNAEDYDLYLRILSENKKLKNISEILLKYRINSKSISHSKKTEQRYYSKKALDYYRQRLNTGYDDYAEMDIKEFENLNYNYSSDVFKSNIEVNLKLGNFKEAKNLMNQYFNREGYFNLILIYYILACFGKKIFFSVYRKYWDFLNLFRI
ncbi:glycosyltransferase involved in cell wall biosynthesis [Methanococcus maripaludis]|uniref:Glycosyltransferase involved in cell wall biosynthesis n=1 Tax=Methanococcus maripaludis TaxID=39152 RepID=A0A7J9P413_METMI|nr:glycosyltransferase [Methanococcus maripaludis]MBA2857945.1 glycosyltransferase involved in cell wall biosynthesis [Methanococcus maripaludis]